MKGFHKRSAGGCDGARARAAERSYPTSEVRGSGPECQALNAQEWPAKPSYPTFKVRVGGWEELPHVRGQGRSRGDTLRPRSGWQPGGATPHPRPVASEVRGGDPEEPPHARGQGPQRGGATQGAVAVQAQEGLEELSHVEGQDRWL